MHHPRAPPPRTVPAAVLCCQMRTELAVQLAFWCLSLCTSPPPAAICCTDECIGAPHWGSDGWCDDGGPSSAYDGCELGSDCFDCDDRPCDSGDSGGDDDVSGCGNTCYSHSCDYWANGGGGLPEDCSSILSSRRTRPARLIGMRVTAAKGIR